MIRRLLILFFGFFLANIHPVDKAFISVCRSVAKTPLPPDDADPETWNTWAQKNLLRPPNTDHGDFFSQDDAEVNALMPHFEKLGLLQQRLPENKSYDAAIVFGGTPWDTKERLLFLKDLIAGGLFASQYVYINGHRALSAQERAYSDALYQHEYAAKLIQELGLQCSVITLPAPSQGRVNTGDVVAYALNEFRDEKSILFISNNPYGPYQGETVEYVRDKNPDLTVACETAYSKARRGVPLAIFTDTMARLLYTKVQRNALRTPPSSTHSEN